MSALGSHHQISYPQLLSKLHFTCSGPWALQPVKKISVKICKIFLTDEKVQNVRLFNLSLSFFTRIFCARAPGGHGGLVFEQTSHLNRKNVNYCAMKVVKIGSNLAKNRKIRHVLAGFNNFDNLDYTPKMTFFVIYLSLIFIYMYLPKWLIK